MATLEKRVQVLFSTEQYERLEAEAMLERMSVGAYIRQAVDGWMDRKRADAADVLQRLFDRVDSLPSSGDAAEDWDEHKDDLLNRRALTDIG